jgi:hypothetical protein
VLARAVQYLLSAIRFCVKTCIWEEGGNVQSSFINFECVLPFNFFWMCTNKSKNLADQLLAWHKYSPLRR